MQKMVEARQRASSHTGSKCLGGVGVGVTKVVLLLGRRKVFIPTVEQRSVITQWVLPSHSTIQDCLEFRSSAQIQMDEREAACAWRAALKVKHRSAESPISVFTLGTCLFCCLNLLQTDSMDEQPATAFAFIPV